MKNNPLELIMGVQEAATLWGLSDDRIKTLCSQKKIISRKIGKTWIVLIDQPNPASQRKSPSL